ncbi:MAG: tRNA (adenosine(37)-N6)-dimethylallyltransferase MiaA [Chlamydiota bacterium]|nr:tRNA (adenosine(37)-N6)-dimethylallyltransferase MiaA [Chlamydiota bacterium]
MTGLQTQYSFSLPIHRGKGGKAIVIAGPTGTGKSEIALLLAQKMGGEIISADSVQVYQGMDIGTAKPTLEERLTIPHHMIDTHTLHETCNIIQFYHGCQKIIQEVTERGNVPIIVGGSGFYLRTLLYGPPHTPPACRPTRHLLQKEINLLGIEPAYRRLCLIDPQYAQTISCRDHHKIMRGLEIAALRGKPLSSIAPPKNPSSSRLLHDFRCWYLYWPKEILNARIEMRCDSMISQGLLREVEKLKKEGLCEHPTASQAIGYQQALTFLESERSPEEWECFVHQFKQVSRRLAKRQRTWFRQESAYRRIDLSKISPLDALKMIIKHYNE